MMDKYEKLRKDLVVRIESLRKLTNSPDSDSYKNLAAELELQFILKLMLKYDEEERIEIEKEIENRVRSNDTLISDSDIDNIKDTGFLFTGIPVFDRKAWSQIQDNMIKSQFKKLAGVK